nr:AraC family transcriptional regulator [Bradyrhizobium campsiandrae]
MFVEHVHHAPGVAPPVQIELMEIILATRSADSLISRKAHGTSVSSPLGFGTTWLCPVGSVEDEVVVHGPSELLHLYLPTSGFAQLSEIYGSPLVRPTAIGQLNGFRDDLICQICQQVLSQMQNPTAAGRVLVDTLALSLTARLVQAYGITQARSPDATIDGRFGLGDVRLRRVLDYMSDHIEQDIGIDELASIACLSPFHFARMFSASMGVPPHRYLSSLRLDRAKSLLSRSDTSIAEIALATCFSTQANFTRAFKAATDMTPGEYRRRAR